MNLQRFVLTCVFVLIGAATALAADYTIKAGSTDVTVYAFLRNASTGNSLGVAKYVRTGDSPVSFLGSQLTNINSGHADGGWKEADGSVGGVLYRIDLPDAAVAAGKRSVDVYLEDDAESPDHLTIDLVGYDPSATALPANVTQISGDVPAANNAERFFDGTGYGVHPFTSTISTVTSQTQFSFSGGPETDHALRGYSVVISDTNGGEDGGIGSSTRTVVDSTYDSGVTSIVIDSAADFTAITSTTLEFHSAMTLANSSIASGTFRPGAIDSAAIATNAIGALELANDAADKIIGISGLADSGSNNTIVDDSLDQSAADYWAGSWVLMTSGQAEGQVRRIKAFAPVSDTITVASPFTAAIAEDDGYVILRTGGADVNVGQWAGEAPVTPNEPGIPRVDVTHVSGEEVCD